jgi:ribosomal protein S18 acetylase RimI-like enzyme
MISIFRATESDSDSIVSIGKISVKEAHKESSSEEDLNGYIERNYNSDVITKELRDTDNIYHLIKYNEQAVGFSKIVLNAKHLNIAAENVTKLDRIYLLKDFHGLKLGLELLNFNIELAKNNGQSGIWLYTWIGNERALKFYLKAGFKIIGSHKFYITETYYNANHQLFLNFA